MVAAILVAVQLLLTAHALVHHHDECDEHAEEHASTCPWCILQHQSAVLPAPPRIGVVLAAIGQVDAGLHLISPRTAPDGTRSIRAPPAGLAVS